MCVCVCACVRVCVHVGMLASLLRVYMQLVELSKAQDIEAGDGTTTVVIMAGSLLSACHKLLEKGIYMYLYMYIHVRPHFILHVC